jgi:hypothetical protein
LSDVFEAIGAIIVRSNTFQFAIRGLLGLLRLLNKLFPESAGNADLFVNKLRQMTTEVDDGTDSLKQSADAVGDISKQYSEAAKAADEFRKQQEEASDVELANELANIENQLARGAIDEPTAKAGEAFFRGRARVRNSASKRASMTAEEKALADKENAAQSSVSDAEATAQKKQSQLDELVKFAGRQFAIKPEEALDPMFIETYLTQNRRLGIKTPELERLATIPRAVQSVREARTQIGTAQKNYENVAGQTAPRRDELNRQINLEYTRANTARLETDTDIRNVARQGSLNTQAVQAAVTEAWGQARYELSGLKGDIVNPMKEFTEMVIELRREIREVKQQSGKARNN